MNAQRIEAQGNKVVEGREPGNIMLADRASKYFLTQFTFIYQRLATRRYCTKLVSSSWRFVYLEMVSGVAACVILRNM